VSTPCASVVALNNFLRALVAGSMSALAPLSDAIGIGWTFTLMAGGNILTMSFLLITHKSISGCWRSAELCIVLCWIAILMYSHCIFLRLPFLNKLNSCEYTVYIFILNNSVD
jgi:hypothetical protein